MPVPISASPTESPPPPTRLRIRNLSPLPLCSAFLCLEIGDMEYSKLPISAFLVVFLALLMGISEGEGEGSLPPPPPPCLTDLNPCIAHLKEEPPPPCCTAMINVITYKKPCLCELFNNVQLLKDFNLTQDAALAYAKKCKPDANVDNCKAFNGNSTSSTPAPVPATGSSLDRSSAFTFLVVGWFSLFALVFKV